MKVYVFLSSFSVLLAFMSAFVEEYDTQLFIGPAITFALLAIALAIYEKE